MKKYGTELEWAGIITLSSLIWMVLEKYLGWHDEYIDRQATYTLLWLPITFSLYYLGLRTKREEDFGGAMSWQKGFASGMVLTAFLVVLSPLAQVVTHRLITPEFFSNMIDYNAGKRMSREWAEMLFSLESYILQTIVAQLILGTIFSAGIAALLRTQSQEE